MAKGKTKKAQTQKLLATVVLGMNLVNTVAPMAALAAAEPQTQLPRQADGEAQPLDYAVLPQALDYLDRAVFATAEATSYGGNSSVASMGDGDYQTITAGQSGAVGTMDGNAIQAIDSSGSGTVSTMSGGTQQINNGKGTVSTMHSGGSQTIIGSGNGTVSTMHSGGEQNILGGNGTVITMSDGTQDISSGSGTVSTMHSGGQHISSGGSGTVITMHSGGQFINSGGNGMVSTISGGQQVIYFSGSGTVSAMSGGTQRIYSGGSATVSTMSGGMQAIMGGGKGTVSALNGGYQYISNGGSGMVSTMSGGSQVIKGGSGMISTMHSGGEQVISSGGIGTVGTLHSGGTQFISSYGSGTVNIMSGGRQEIVSFGIGTVSTMSGGFLLISSGGSGTVITMSGGTQTIRSGGSGTVSTMHSGSQTINSSGIGTVDIMYSGGQHIGGGSGTVNTMSGGRQNIDGGSGTVGTMHSGGEQNIGGGIGIVNTMHSGGAQYIIGGSGTVSTMSGGTQYISSGGSGTVSTMSGGTQVIVSDGRGTVDTMYSGQQYISSGGSGTVSALSGGTQVVSSGGTSLDTVLTGGIIDLASGGTALSATISAGTMQFASGGVVSDLTMSGGSLALERVSGGSFTVSGTMTANNGIIDMTDSSVTRAPVTPTYESLTINKLQGSGNTFIMDTDLAGGANSDKVTITSADVGTHYVQIRDLSKLNSTLVTGVHQQLLITDNSGKLTFAGKELNSGGLFDVTPTMTQGDKLGLSANDWYLTKIAKTVNNDTQVLLDAADNSYAMWRNTNDSLRSRLGALGNGSEHADGIWARTQAGRFSGSGYEGRYNMYQLGYDQQADVGSTYGFAVDYGDGTGTYDPGSSKDKLAAFSLYGVWQGDKGTYTNVTARAGIFDTDLESYGDFSDKAGYKQHAYSVSVEYGQRFDLQQGLFFEPQAQFTLGHLKGINYTTDRGANGHIDAMNSAIGRIGFIMGQKIKNGSDIYLKADLLHEFAGKRDLQLTSDAGGTNDILSKHNDYGDTWFELGLGANIKLSKDSSFYGEVERGFGGDINKKWSVNAGLRFAF